MTIQIGKSKYPDIGGVYIPEENEKVGSNTSNNRLKDRNKSKKKKANIREYNPEKDKKRILIGGYSSYIKKKEIVAESN